MNIKRNTTMRNSNQTKLQARQWFACRCSDERDRELVGMSDVGGRFGHGLAYCQVTKEGKNGN